MAEVITIALIERKPGVSRSLYSRYWRDVHGVMAVRITGFGSYTQNHITPMHDVGARNPEPWEGIAVLTFFDEKDRHALVTSQITKYIHRDEQNVFRRALLYNLAPGAGLSFAQSKDAVTIFLVVPQGHEGSAVAKALTADGASHCTLYDLASGDPKAWNAADVDEGRRFAAIIETRWTSEKAGRDAVSRAIAKSDGAVAAYKLDERWVMVENGRPTPIGLRGLDAVRTIEEINAVNQLEHEIEDAIYGKLARS